MGADQIIVSLLTLLAGIGIFLVACKMMSSNLETASSSKLRNLFGKVSDNKLLGISIGALSTAAIQSSGATTVMIIGFVNVGILSLTQAATLIYGANIGTTITAQIVALGLSGQSLLSTSVIFASFAGVGAFLELFTKSERWKTFGGILAGFGMLFVGLNLMSDSMASFAQHEGVKSAIAYVTNPLFLVLLGALLTAIIQSSSVLTSIAITMVVSGLITLNQGIYLTMGSNIGSCVVALIAGMTSSLNAKRTALIHLFFNCFGVLVFMLMGLAVEWMSHDRVTFGILFEKMFPNAPQLQLAMFHTFFNVATVAVITPLTNYLVALVEKILPETTADKDKEFEPHFYFVAEQMLQVPLFAVRQVKLEIENMASIAMHNYDLALEMITQLTFEHLEEFKNNETQLNFLNKALVQYVVRLNSGQFNHIDHQYLTSAIRSIGDLERIGDYAENITEYAQTLQNTKDEFSALAKEEIEELRELIFTLYQQVMKAYIDIDVEALERANAIEDKIDDLTEMMEANYVERLSQGVCTSGAGACFLEFASDSERIADHLINVGKTIRNLIDAPYVKKS